MIIELKEKLGTCDIAEYMGFGFDTNSALLGAWLSKLSDSGRFN